MTAKELLYLEDALGHEKLMQDTCLSYGDLLADKDLKEFVYNLSDRHADCFEALYERLEG